MDTLTQAVNQATKLAKLRIAQRAQKDLFFLAKYILNYTDMSASTHGDLCRYTEALMTPHSTPKDTEAGLEIINSSPPPTMPQNFSDDTLDVQPNIEAVTAHTLKDSFDPAKNFLLLLMPRGTFKSSVVTIGFSLQMILNDPNVRILIDSETFSKSKAFLNEIKGHLEGNEKFREIYYTLYSSYPDDRKRDDLWTDSQVNISARTNRRKEATFSCAGIDVTKTGMHYDLIIADDLMSEKNITTKEQMDQVVTHYKLTLSLLDPGKPLIVIGTRWDYNDVYQYILDNESRRFNVLVRKAIADDGSLLFPERLTHEFLETTKQSQGSYIFSCQYQNEPVDNESATFKRSMLVRKPWDEVKDRPMNWYLSIDPSFEGPYSDYAAFVVAGMDFQRELFVRHILRAKMTYSTIIENIFSLYYEYNPQHIVIETIATQKSLQYELNNEQKRRGVWLPITEIKGMRKSKEDRIRGLAPFYEFGHIYHIKECHQLDDLEYELIHFPRGTHDDIVDALATVLEVANPPSVKRSTENREKRSRMIDMLTKPRSPLTGV